MRWIQAFGGGSLPIGSEVDPSGKGVPFPFEPGPSKGRQGGRGPFPLGFHPWKGGPDPRRVAHVALRSLPILRLRFFHGAPVGRKGGLAGARPLPMHQHGALARCSKSRGGWEKNRVLDPTVEHGREGKTSPEHPNLGRRTLSSPVVE